MSTAGRWGDLPARVASGAALVLVGMLGVWLGGLWFHILVALICGVMIWELVGMVDAPGHDRSRILGLVAGIAVFVAIELPPGFALPLLMLPAMAGMTQMRAGAVTYAVFTALILLAGYSLMALRDDFGLIWMAWLALVVVATDICGYFAGRIIGGPKLWERVSPKKTWSGAIAGWIGAALVGWVIIGITGAGPGLIGVSIAMSMASQIGDIAESAVKRRVGVKDSSNLIPGHGGLLDRFDGMLGAAVFIIIAGQIAGFPPGLA